jgi:hypothetical protein
LAQRHRAEECAGEDRDEQRDARIRCPVSREDVRE